MRDALLRWLGRQLGVDVAEAAIERIGTGHSRAMFRVTLADGARFVVRVEQGGVFGTSGAEEARIMRGLHAAGFPVARIVGAEPSGMIIGQPFFVMEHLDAGAAAADERAVDGSTAAAFVDTVHRLHQVDPSGIEFDLVPPTPSHSTPMQVERWRSVYRSATAMPIPLLDEAAAWLVHRAPPLERLSIVHGDAGPGNFVHDGGRIVALTDFEFSHLGDPAEDWSYCLAMRGARTMPDARWRELFARHAGVAMDVETWRYWEAFNLFKGACANRTCLTLFETGVNRAPNMAIIGTTLHQVFLRRLVDLVA
ncbi:MAG: phosphotransferase family protein [Ilumatobacteraceae bacterium]